MKYQKAYILTTAKVAEIEKELIPKESVHLASSSQVVGEMPLIPVLEDQKDLTKLVAILLSTGINRNDDVFLPSEILPIRSTGAHKPVNLEHDPKQIIGHMLRTFATEKNGDRVPDGEKPEGKFFDITAEAVLYSFLFPELVSDIKNRANGNNLFVSVEVWFTGFDYAVGSKIIKRNSHTASSLDGRLKVNGGNGTFEGKRLGRVLRDMIVGGIGVVKEPANPESIIKSVSSFNSEVVQDIEDNVISSHIIGDLSISHENEYVNFIEQEVEIMNPDVLEEMAVLAGAIKATAGAKDNAEEVVENNSVDTDADNSPVLQALSSRLESLEKDNKELQARANEADFKVQTSQRAQALASAGIPDDMLDQHLIGCLTMSEEQFKNYASLLLNTFNSMGKAEASVSAEAEVTEEATETAEGGDEAGTEEASAVEEVTEEVVDTTSEVIEDAVETEVSQPADEVVEDEVEIDIEAVDPDISTEGDGSAGEPSITDRMGNTVQKFLAKKDNKWGNLSLEK